MDDLRKTKAQLAAELQALRRQVAELESSASGPMREGGGQEAQSLAALRESEEKYRTLFRDSVLAKSLTMDGKLIDVNPAWLKLHGYDRKDEVIGMDVLDVIHPADRAILVERRNASTYKTARACQYRDLRKDGSVVEVEVHSSQILLRGVEAIHATMEDITERKRAEREKEALQAQLLQSQKMEALGVLAGGIAHDFNNHLTTIKGFTELLMMETNKANPAYTDLERIHNASNRAASLVHQLLLFSRKHQMEFGSVDLNGVVHNLLEMIRRIIGEDIEVRVELDKEASPIWGDPTSLEQIVTNLVVNARDAMPEGGTLTIATRSVQVGDGHRARVAQARSGRFVCLSITDTGVGMDKDTLRHIFEPFFTTKRRGKGTGLGLAVVYGIMEQHGGWIEVDTEPKKGAEFRAYFPISLRPPEEIEAGPDPQRGARGNGERIIVVEDDRRILDFMAKVLCENGYCPLEASSAREAIEVFDAQEDIALVFTDCVLPDKDGLCLVERLLSRKPSMGVVLTSGYTDDRSHRDIIREKGFTFLQKPYGVRDMLQAIWRELHNSARSARD